MPKYEILRHQADRRSLVWSLIAFPLFPIAVYRQDLAIAWAIPLGAYLAFCAGVLTHNHNHSPVFVHGTLNRLYSVWLSVFYGFPIFSWVPTHNQNHHRFINGPGDATSTDRLGRDDCFLNALVYPLFSSGWQRGSVLRYARRLRDRHPVQFRWAMTQVVVVFAVQVVGLCAFVVRHGTAGWLLGFVALLGPALFAPWSMMFINYIQHVGCEPHSPDAHSRNFVGKLENWFVFNAGLHTVHHETPGLHWSALAKAHEARSAAIPARLQQRNVFSFLFRHYLLGEKSQPLVEPSRPYLPTSAAKVGPAGSCDSGV
jgi:fatty acid desaturase